jgi:hypothetical protein
MAEVHSQVSLPTEKATSMPDSRRRKATVRFKVKIEDRRMRVLATGVVEANTYMGLKGTLIVRESNVPIYPEQGAATGPCVGNKERTQV